MEETFLISKVKNAVPWTYVASDFNGEEIYGTFFVKELQKTNQTEFRVKKVIKKKVDKLCAKWKCYVNSLNSWNDKKDDVKWIDFFLSHGVFFKYLTRKLGVQYNNTFLVAEQNNYTTKIVNVFIACNLDNWPKFRSGILH